MRWVDNMIEKDNTKLSIADVIKAMNAQSDKKNSKKKQKDYNAEEVKTNVNWFGIIIFIGLIIIGLLSITIINTGYVGVKHEFGMATTVLPAGIHFLVPLKDNVALLNTQVLKYSVPSSSVSKDLQMVTTTITVNYKIKDKSALDIWTNFRGQHEIRIIDPLTHETLKAISAQYTASELIQKRDIVKNVVTVKLKERLNDYGLDVVEVSLVDFQFSEVFDKAIEEKMVAEQEKLKMQQELEKTQIEVQKLVATANAESESKKLVADANAYQKKVEADAEAYYLQKTSQAQSDAIDRIKSKISGDYLNYWYIENWDGVLPLVTSDSGLLLNMDVKRGD